MYYDKVYFYDIDSEKLPKTIIIEGHVLIRDSIFIADFLGNIYK